MFKVGALLMIVLFCSVSINGKDVCEQDNTLINTERTITGMRPPIEERLFRSEAVEKTISNVKKQLKNQKLAEMFEICFPNTLDTTVHFSMDEAGNPDTFVYTGDIHAMWLRDSSAQVYPYLMLVSQDDALKDLIKGVIFRQMKCIILDPYANAFNNGPTGGEWQSDYTKMLPEIHERKWEIDSLCYPIRLMYEYWKRTGDSSIFETKDWLETIDLVLQTFQEQQRKDDKKGPYRFLRKTDRALDTLNNSGWGAPVSGCGLIVSSFRPSDDATTLQYLVPSNFFAVTSLKKAAEILKEINGDDERANRCSTLAEEIDNALKEYAVYDHPEFGEVYAYEVDGFGNQLLMDDANVPSLLSMPYLGDVDISNPIYQNTRKLVWSTNNPYFFKGSAGEGIGGPHVGYDMAWPMSIMMKAFTSTDDEEIKNCIEQLMTTDADTGFMHESFDVNNANNYTRDWFAWQNTLFGELILTLIEQGKLNLLNSIE